MRDQLPVAERLRRSEKQHSSFRRAAPSLETWIKRGTSIVNEIRLTTFLPFSRCYAETGRHSIPRRDSGQDPRQRPRLVGGWARAGFSFRSASTILPRKFEQSAGRHSLVASRDCGMLLVLCGWNIHTICKFTFSYDFKNLTNQH